MKLLTKTILVTCMSIQFAVFAADTAGHGGDGLRFIFRTARKAAALKILEFHWDEEKQGKKTPVVEWIEKNKKELSTEVIESDLNWTEKVMPTCARTELRTKAPVMLSFSACQSVLTERGLAEKILIHEAVHHFAIIDEKFADDVASLIFEVAEIEYVCTIYRGWNNSQLLKTVALSPRKNVQSVDLGDGKYWVNIEMNVSFLGIHFWDKSILSAGAPKYVLGYNHIQWGTETASVSNKIADARVTCRIK